MGDDVDASADGDVDAATVSDLGDKSRWSFFDFVPRGGATPSGLVMRFDTSSPTGFAAASSWESFDVASVNASSRRTRTCASGRSSRANSVSK